MRRINAQTKRIFPLHVLRYLERRQVHCMVRLSCSLKSYCLVPCDWLSLLSLLFHRLFCWCHIVLDKCSSSVCGWNRLIYKRPNATVYSSVLCSLFIRVGGCVSIRKLCVCVRLRRRVYSRACAFEFVPGEDWGAIQSLHKWIWLIEGASDPDWCPAGTTLIGEGEECTRECTAKPERNREYGSRENATPALTLLTRRALCQTLILRG